MEESIHKTKNINTCFYMDCNKKIKLTDFPCRCKLTFCSLHRHSESHNCTFDYKEYGKTILEKTVIGCKNEKVCCI